MNIEDEARQEAERRWPHTGDTTVDIRRSALRHTFEKGAVWASEQAEAIDRMGPAAGCHLCFGAGGYPDHHGQWVECSCQRPDREPSEAEVEHVADAVEAASAQWEFEFDQYRAGSRTYADPGPKAEYIARAALIATQEVRDES